MPVGVTVPASTPVDNATFLDIGGSPYEGTPQPAVRHQARELNNGKSIVPMFNVFTDVPIPSRLRGLIIDDINFSTDPRSTMYGEKAGIPFVPVGIYDFANRLVVHDRDRLQRHLRRADAVDEPHQLPDAVRRLREHVPVRGQRPRHPRAR